MEKKDKLLPITPIPGNVYAPYENNNQNDIDAVSESQRLLANREKEINANEFAKNINSDQTNNKNAINISAETNFEQQPDSFLDFYKKYVPPPKENKETENSLRRLALAELIQKGIAGVGNVAYAKFGGKNKQWDSQPVSNTYLKSIEAADQRRKYFDSLNHDYKKGMFNVAVEDWKYKKGKEQREADQLRADQERNEDYENRLSIAILQEEGKNARTAKMNEVRQKLAGLRLNNVPEQSKIPSQYSETITTEGGNVYVAPQGLVDIYLKAKDKGYGKDNLVVNLQDIKPQDKVTMYNVITEAINNADDDVFKTIQEVRYGGTGKIKNTAPQSNQTKETDKYNSYFRKK
jgi:hypothetical protein